MKEVRGLLVMAYGTPYKEEDIERYYTHIRHGRKPSQEHLDDLTERYRAIGGISPLAKMTEAQAHALCARLNEVQDEVEYKVFIGLKHIEPFVEDAVEAMVKEGITEAVSIVLAPHFSTFSIKSYNGRAKEAAEKLGGTLNITSVEAWYDEPKFIEFWKDAVNGELAKMTEEERANACLIVSNHSLPEKIKLAGDPYEEQLVETARLIEEASDIVNVEVGWQSAGQTPEPWLGPDVQDLTKELFEQKGYKAFIYTPVGFVTEHLEVLYDNDIECKVVCDEIGASYYRPTMPNTHPLFIDAMVDAINKKLAE
ncbi:ferrochelatase [Solibacillus sp. FSL W7-1472]|uniref:Coproporphyrin III ferrochelatase n=2 Tax=Solibacillus TaxID=648800 RepID=F2F026_SOLSS|nr:MULTISPECIES: ferrochelatase [Solibacillus]AMO86852.1 ferrochelatase [Solibacillus silvestris]EKB44908.1 Ferrochelatase [Solibacillus isronensis B3W22]OBW56926.1 ferrochelatase [Solibacillus silvestris]BAK15136.1 protoheme ferro-lyase [Solibacillus silvestris StLB046]